MAVAEPLALPPEDAIRHFQAKGLRVGFDWRDTAAEQHLRGFTVAKMMDFDMLHDVRQAVDRAITDGTTYEQFRREVEPMLREKGWWGRKLKPDPARPNEPPLPVQLGSPRRLETIFQVNVRTAYATGQWQRIERVAGARPYLRYSATLDGRTRPQHRAWHGIILPWDHPFWETHYPPNGWRCRCTVTQWSEDDLEEHGWQVSPDPDIVERDWYNSRLDKTIQVPVGIDPGWAHNVGKLNQRIHSRQIFIDKIKAWPEMGDKALEMRTRDFEHQGFKDFIANARTGYKTFWPVASIPESRAKALGLAANHTRIVDITPDTVSKPKHRERFTQFTAKDWARIQTMVNDRGDWIQRTPNIWLVETDHSGKPWRAVIKVTPDEILLTSYYRIKRQQRKGKRGPGGA